MSEEKLYYTPPTDEVFNDVKNNALSIWESYDNTFGYVDKKKERTNIENVGDNFMFIVAQFDLHNRFKLFKMIKDESKNEILKRL